VSNKVGLVVLLLATCKTDGASVAVDSTKDSYVKPAAAETDTKEAAAKDQQEQLDPRIGLYTQKVEAYGSVGPIGGNSAFYLTSLLPGYGNCRFAPCPCVHVINVGGLGGRLIVS
jgi:hypothetical protein